MEIGQRRIEFGRQVIPDRGACQDRSGESGDGSIVAIVCGGKTGKRGFILMAEVLEEVKQACGHEEAKG